MQRTPPTARAALAALAAAALTAALPVDAAADAGAGDAAAPAAEPVRLLFVGNSYTFGRAAPVLGYNAAAVHDLTAGFNAVNPAGTHSHPGGQDSFEPHPWGGVPGIFKKMADQAGLRYEVSLSTRNAASLRDHFLNTPNADWDLRGNVARQTWHQVVLQDQSEAALPAGRSRNANPAAFAAYTDRFEAFIHTGLAQRFSEAELHGGLAACLATGLSQPRCESTHRIAANPHASAATQVFLEQTWARPDMVEAHAATEPDLASDDGRPVIRPGQPAGRVAPVYASLAAMTADLHRAVYAKAAANPGFAGVVPVGDVFQRAVDQGLARGRGFFGADGLYRSDATLLDLWWLDRTHASREGSYLSALTLFGVLTGRDPLSLTANEQAAADLGIDAATAAALQRVASEQLGFRPAGPRPAAAPAETARPGAAVSAGAAAQP